NSEAEVRDTALKQCGAGFPARPVRRTFQSGLGRLESRPNWQTRMSAPRKAACGSLANFGIQTDFKSVRHSTGIGTAPVPHENLISSLIHGILPAETHREVVV
ncbi:MAG TPA: hypothetical protein VFS12_04985, partial [Terriglobia bacterium]|nr:hypothetical protein [Terriglobia bacterium]